MSRNIFQGNTNSSNIFTNNNNNPSQSNIFTRNQQSTNQNNNIFTSQNNSGSSNNIFNNQNTQGNTQGNTQQGNNIFNNNQNQNQNQGGNIFNQGNTNQGNNIFNNNQSNNLFNNNNQNQGNNIFNNQGNNQGNNLFNNNNQQGNNIFSQNNQANNNIFTQNSNSNQNRPNNYQPIDYQYFAQQPIRNILRCTPQQQMHLIRSMNVAQTRRLIELCIKGLVDPIQLQRMSLSDGNFIRNIKVKDVAAKLNIKRELLFIKKQVKDNVIAPIAKLKRHNDAIVKAERQLSQRLQQKLLDLKQKLLQATTESKLIQQLKEEIEQIDNQIKQFLKAQLYSNQGKTTYKLVDPDPFCIKISQRILKNISLLDDKMDELIACETSSSQQSINISETIEQLVEYYENVAIQLKDFSEKFKGIKRDFLSKRRSNYQGSLDHIRKKSIQKVEKEMRAYSLLKDIEKILEQREKFIKKA